MVTLSATYERDARGSDRVFPVSQIAKQQQQLIQQQHKINLLQQQIQVSSFHMTSHTPACSTDNDDKRQVLIQKFVAPTNMRQKT